MMPFTIGEREREITKIAGTSSMPLATLKGRIIVAPFGRGPKARNYKQFLILTQVLYYAKVPDTQFLTFMQVSRDRLNLEVYLEICMKSQHFIRSNSSVS